MTPSLLYYSILKVGSIIVAWEDLSLKQSDPHCEQSIDASISDIDIE